MCLVTIDVFHIATSDLHSADHQRLEQQRKRRLPSRKTSIEKSDARDDQPNDGTAEQKVCIMEFEALVRRIHIDLGRVAAIGVGRVKLGLHFGVFSMYE